MNGFIKVFVKSVLLLIFSLIIGVNCLIPKFIHVCQRKDPELVKCINNSLTILKPYLKVGIPELEVPPLEPLLLDSVDLKSGSNSTHIAATLSNLKIWGPTLFIVEELNPNLEKYIFKFKALIPQLHIEGNYETDAKVLFVNLKGHGPANINISNFHIDCRLKGNKISRDGKEYLEFEPMKLKINIGKSSIRLENLFNGDPVLGKATGDVINDNADLFMNEIKPNLQSALSEKFTSIANKITLRFTYQELFP